MDDLEQQGRNRADDPLWTASLRELSSLMPGLSSQIDLTSGSLTTSTDSIREQTEAWRLDALAAAETAAQISKVGALETAEGRKADAEINLAYAQSRMNTELEKILPAAQAMNEALTDNSTVARPTAFAASRVSPCGSLRASSGSGSLPAPLMAGCLWAEDTTARWRVRAGC